MKNVVAIVCLAAGLWHAEASFAAADTLANEGLQHGELNSNAARVEPDAVNPDLERTPPAKRDDPAVRAPQSNPARVAPRPAEAPRAQSLLPGTR